MHSDKKKPNIIDIHHQISADRSLVLHVSTQIETHISHILQIALGLHGKETISFGDSSMALAFSAKTLLFLDFRVLNKEQQKRFVKLMEIRNQFAHNARIKSFEELDVNKNGKQAINFLEKTYSLNIKDYSRNNNSLRELFLLLIRDIESILFHILDSMSKKATEYGTTKAKIMKCDVLQGLLMDQSYLKTIDKDSRKVLEQFLDEANKRTEKLIEIERRENPDHISGVPLI